MNRATIHHPETEQLLRYLDADLSWAARRSSRKHLAHCARCRALVEDVRQAEAAVARYCGPSEPHSPEWKAGMRADLDARLDQAEDALDAPPWRLPVGRPALAMLLVAFAALAGVAMWVRLPRPAVEEAPVSPAPAPSPIVPAPTRPAVRAPRPETPPPPPAVTDSPEVAAIEALHKIGADLGEPVRVSEPDPNNGAVTVYSGDVGPERELQIRAALAAVPGVTFRMEPLDGARSSGGARSLKPQRTPLHATLETALGGPGAFRTMANAALDEDDQMMAAAHALHNLDVRFPAAREARLNERDQAALRAIREHLTSAFAARAARLLAAIAPARRALAAKGETAPAGIFESARRMDRVTLALFGGASTTLSAGELAAEFDGAASQLAQAAGVKQ